ncbi:hypothetical protein DDZ16_19685 [Marinilabilia rubra]|uniref:Cell surface protein n=2 Tax=Marinilabilia rubra TaxID=2162893 RepID=A0A2U2B3M3_9BACT|nr:hypothetical protein DDZ16_19685 [Marinilabilia rubra]
MTEMKQFKKFVCSNNLLKVLSLSLLILFTACENDDNSVDEFEVKGDFVNGVFVLNQGLMNAANASVSFISDDSVAGNIFTNRNDVQILGDVLQDMVSVDTLSFLVLNKTNSVMVVNNKNFESVKEISESISNPRYALVNNGLIYVSQWGNGGELAVIDPVQLEVINTIEVGAGPEGLAMVNGELWVANCGGYGRDTIISVVDVSQGLVKEEIEVNDNPQDLVVDGNGDVWVLSTGYTEYDENWAIVMSTEAGIHKINPDTYEVEETFLPDESVYGKATRIEMAADGQSFYFGGAYGFSGVWEMAVDATELPQETFADVTPNGMTVNPDNGDLYIGIAPDYENPGIVEVYGTNGVKIATYDENIGVGPCNFIFVSE